jgi:hypothetical protein
VASEPITTDVGPQELSPDWPPKEPRVFVTNLAGHDYTKAEKYGKIVPITHGYVSFQSLDRVKFQITEEVRKSKPHDWLLLSGTPLLSVIAAVAWFAIHDCVNLLVYDQKDHGKYRELRISQKNVNDMLAVLGDSDGT